MTTEKLKIILGLTGLFAVASPGHSQTVRIEFRCQVTEVLGSPLVGVGVGSLISGWAEVDLVRMPLDGDPWPSLGSYTYSSPSGGLPGFTMEFDTGFERITYDSINAASGPGHTPGIFMYDGAGSRDWLLLQARDQGNPFAAVLSFEDITRPWRLLSGDYFPESVSFGGGLDRGRFDYFDYFGANSLVAEVILASLTVEPGGPLTLLAMRVNASNLPAQRKQVLLRILRASETALDRGRCRAGLQGLRGFQNVVRAYFKRSDPMLADRLISGAQAIINAGCTSEGK